MKNLMTSFIISLLLILSLKDVSMPEETISLPEVLPGKGLSVEEAISRRVSIRSFKPSALTTEEISRLLWSSYGYKSDSITSASRTIPSAGALYPMEILLFSSSGVFQYLPEKHSLKTLDKKDNRKILQKAAYGQSPLIEAPVTIAIACVYERITRKYGERGIQYAYYEAGHIAQNILLEATFLGLGGVPIGAFDGRVIQQSLSLTAKWDILYLLPIGRPR